jgi:hypothetical protein
VEIPGLKAGDEFVFDDGASVKVEDKAGRAGLMLPQKNGDYAVVWELKTKAKAGGNK